MLATARSAPWLIALISVAVHLRAVLNGYAFDDVAIVAHPMIQSVRRLPMALVSPWWFDSQHLYRPLSLLSLGIDRVVGAGMPWLPHAVNVVLHAVIAALITRLALRFLPARAAFASGLFFTLLPVHVEAVASVVGRAELLSALWLVLLMLLVTRDEPFTARTAALAALLAALALASKEGGAVAPALALVAAAAWPAQRKNAGRWFLAAMLGTVVLLSVRFAVLGSLVGDLPHPFYRGMSVATRVAIALALLPRTMAMLFLPVPPAIEAVPTLAAAEHPAMIAVALGAALVLSAVALALVHVRRPSLLTLGCCVAAIALAPVANLLFAVGEVLTGRTLYGPSIGAALMMGAFIAVIGESRLRRAVPFVVGVTCIDAAYVSWNEIGVWRNTTTVVAMMIQRDPENYRAHEFLAFAARDAGRPREELEHYRDAIARFPADPEMLTDAATLALREGDSTTAKRWLRAAVDVSPRSARARTRLYGILRSRGDSASAKRLLEDGLRVEPSQRSWAALLGEQSRVIKPDARAGTRTRTP